MSDFKTRTNRIRIVFNFIQTAPGACALFFFVSMASLSILNIYSLKTEEIYLETVLEAQKSFKQMEDFSQLKKSFELFYKAHTLRPNIIQNGYQIIRLTIAGDLFLEKEWNPFLALEAGFNSERSLYIQAILATLDANENKVKIENLKTLLSVQMKRFETVLKAKAKTESFQAFKFYVLGRLSFINYKVNQDDKDLTLALNYLKSANEKQKVSLKYALWNHRVLYQAGLKEKAKQELKRLLEIKNPIEDHIDSSFILKLVQDCKAELC